MNRHKHSTFDVVYVWVCMFLICVHTNAPLEKEFDMMVDALRGEVVGPSESFIVLCMFCFVEAYSSPHLCLCRLLKNIYNQPDYTVSHPKRN
jgi:hypothetical protein